MSAASCDGTQATWVSQDAKLRRWGGVGVCVRVCVHDGSSLVIVCGHVRRQSWVGWECQGVGIIADSILRA